jgi:hypothetical protein
LLAAETCPELRPSRPGHRDAREAGYVEGMCVDDHHGAAPRAEEGLFCILYRFA